MDVPRLIEDDAELGHHINATSDRVMDNKVMTLEYDVVCQLQIPVIHLESNSLSLVPSTTAFLCN